MRRIRAVLAATALGALLLLPQPAVAAPAAAAHPRVTTVVASSQYIVYEQQTSAKELTPGNSARSTLYATDIAGQRLPLPGFTTGHHPVLVAESLVVQAANTLHTVDDRQTVRYLDLNTGKGGTWTGEQNEDLVGAAPDGWLMRGSTGADGRYGTVERLTYVHRDGTRSDLGVPYPGGQRIGVTVSDTGVVLTPGVSDETRFRTAVLYQPWKGIGTSWRTLFTAKEEQVAIGCAPSSTTTVACVRSPEEGEGEGPFSYGLISLSGKGARWMVDSHPHACQRILFATLGSDLVAVENSDIGTCTKGKLYRFTWSGGLVSGGSHHYSATSIITGLQGFRDGRARIVLSSTDQRHIDALTGVTRSPFVVVRV
jgi:hypothetical protein